MTSAYRFIQKFWLMNDQIINLLGKEEKKQNDEIEIFTNQFIEKINFALEKFRYNVIIAVMHEIYSFYKKIADRDENNVNLRENFIKILTVITPITPHLASECIHKLNHKKDLKWPEVIQKYLTSEKSEIVIQINGKKRNTISIKKGAIESNVIESINKMNLISKYLDGKKIFKTIYVKDRIINFIIK